MRHAQNLHRHPQKLRKQNFHNLKVLWLCFFHRCLRRFCEALASLFLLFWRLCSFVMFAYLSHFLSCTLNSCKSDSGLFQVEISLTTILGLLALIYGLEYGLAQASDSPCLLQRRCPGDDVPPGGILSLQVLNDLARQSVDSVDCKQRRVRCVRSCL